MLSHSPPPLPIEPFQRLQVTDGLLLTAERWRQAHDYHRQRQNTHYQALNQAGIVWGLGVCVLSPPMDIAEEYRDRRWVQIQPGIAIDANGNPIIVPHPLAFRIASVASPNEPLAVYLMIRYVDPDRLQGQRNRELVQESFRIDETTNPSSQQDVELCRILLTSGDVQLTPATNALSPLNNQLDLRFRQKAQAHSTEVVRVAQFAPAQPHSSAFENLSSLLQATTALYPAMQGIAVEPMPLADNAVENCDLLYLNYHHLLLLQESEQETLRAYLTTGAVLLVEISAKEANIAELGSVQQQLKMAIANLGQDPTIAEVRQELETELRAVEVNLNQLIQNIAQTVQNTIQQIGIPAGTLEPLGRQHLLRTQPFLFAQLPIINNSPIQIFNWEGVVLVIGSLSEAWGLDEGLALPREVLRSAQELGINLLHFAGKRHQLTQLQQAPPASTP